MRRSSRLTSIHEDDSKDSVSVESTVEVNDNGNTAVAKNKKFVPTIPTVRRKKVEETPESASASSSTVPQSQSQTSIRQQQQRKPLASRQQQQNQPAIVSGPLSMGPAAMARSSSRSGASSSVGSILSARSLSRTSSSSISSNSALNSKPLSDSVPIEEEFGVASSTNGQDQNLLKPVALSPSEVSNLPNPKSNDFGNNDKLLLFQMPPVLPTLLNNSATASSSTSSDLAEADKWPVSAQGRYAKLRRYKSGRLVLVLENGVEFVVAPSSDAEAQNTNVMAIDPEFSQSFNLGPVQQKFVCVPEFDKFQKL